MLEDVVGLADELHIAVLDAVVDHLDVVTRTLVTDVGHTRTLLGLGGNLGEDGLDGVEGLSGTTRHEGRTVTSARFTTRDAHAHVEDTLGLELLGAADGLLVPLIATIDEDITRLGIENGS